MPTKRLPQEPTNKRRQQNQRVAILPTTEAMVEAFERFLALDVANGDAAEDTVYTYQRRVIQYIDWCDRQSINPALANEEDVKLFRRYLVQEKHQKSATVALTLSVVRRFYEAALSKGLVKENPAAQIKPPKEKLDPAERVTYLQEEELKQLLAVIPHDGSRKSLRDRALLGIMALQGPRTVELHRANFGDLVRSGSNWGLRVEGKGSIRTIPLRPDLSKVLWQYLQARESAGEELAPESPLFVAASHRFEGQRLSRRGIRWIVDEYLVAAKLKTTENATEGRRLSAHSLRHTAGTLGLRKGADLRQVQDLLGHKDPKTTALYAHVNDRHAFNPALGIDVEV
ncbi:tyrosine-type recombinase/integrase [[Phormidium] sp. LEGE 05292]|uniref:tyrosine-type recombinase/integrase n=1 Tax=[Phormidium] sp. LEGE 05292 TaxID=767427 RepID=UPI002AD26467|nr:tyrosine-type recombinase/integrase [Phormidium sp. LEGE 05292]